MWSQSMRQTVLYCSAQLQPRRVVIVATKYWKGVTLRTFGQKITEKSNGTLVGCGLERVEHVPLGCGGNAEQ